jgi:lysophospholipase L1-like esterase
MPPLISIRCCSLLRSVRKALLAIPLLTVVATGFTTAPLPLVAADTTPAAARGSWHLTDGDRVVLLGEGFIEREGQQGILETSLIASHPDMALEFRNLGWNGDTVWAESRGVFDSPAEGYRRLMSLMRELQPTVTVVAYGRNESYAGDAGLAPFREQLTQLCSDITRPAAAPAEGPAPPQARLVLVTPPPFLPAPTCPDADTRNTMLSEYAAVIREVAAAQHAGLVDLFAAFPKAEGATTRFSVDGLHLTPAGYWAAARIFVESSGRTLPAASDREIEAIRMLVAAKNELFFHRWRPANETYLFLFRRHEQGNNAVEIPQFDPLVEQAEAKVRAAVATIR